MSASFINISVFALSESDIYESGFAMQMNLMGSIQAAKFAVLQKSS